MTAPGQSADDDFDFDPSTKPASLNGQRDERPGPGYGQCPDCPRWVSVNLTGGRIVPHGDPAVNGPECTGSRQRPARPVPCVRCGEHRPRATRRREMPGLPEPPRRTVRAVTGRPPPPPVDYSAQYPWPVHPAAEEFPELDGADLADLADDIKAHGLREPIWLYDDPGRGTMLLDGRNRWRACQLAGADCRTRRYVGEDPIGFSVSLNLKRRHLTPGQRAFLALEIEKLYAAETRRGRPANEGGEKVADLRPFPKWKRKSVARAATTTGASGRAVSQAKRVLEVAPDLADKVRSGRLAIDRAERIIRDRDAERKHVARVRAEAAAVDAGTSVDIRAGDFREVLADLRDVDAVITDPPYGAEFLPLFGDLGAWADKVLKPDGVLVVMLGEMYLFEVGDMLRGYRPYRWQACYLTPGPGYV